MEGVSDEASRNETTSYNHSIETGSFRRPPKLIEFKIIWKNYNYFVQGTVENNSPQKINYAQIIFGVYDENYNRLGTAIANINDLEPYSTWKFEALIWQKNFKYVRFIDIDYW